MAHGNTEHQEPLLQDQQQHTAEQNGTGGGADDPECQVIEGELTTLGHQKATASLGSVISALLSLHLVGGRPPANSLALDLDDREGST